MHKFHYRAGKSAFMGLMMAAAAMFAGWIWVTSPDSTWLSAGLALLCGAEAIKVAMDAMSDTPALAFDGQELRLRRPWGQVAAIPWSDVQAMTVEIMTLRYWGIIPIAKHENLVVKCNGGPFGSKRHRLALKMVALPRAGAAELMALLDTAHVAAVGASSVAMAGGDRDRGWGSRSAGAAPSAGVSQPEFDADAALSRYLARKDAAPVHEQPAAPVVATPPRPVFGRKAQAG